MTFQDNKKAGKDFGKTKAKREVIHPKDVVKANTPKSVYDQVDDELRGKESKSE